MSTSNAIRRLARTVLAEAKPWESLFEEYKEKHPDTDKTVQDFKKEYLKDHPEYGKKPNAPKKPKDDEDESPEEKAEREELEKLDREVLEAAGLQEEDYPTLNKLFQHTLEKSDKADQQTGADAANLFSDAMEWMADQIKDVADFDSWVQGLPEKTKAVAEKLRSSK